MPSRQIRPPRSQGVSASAPFRPGAPLKLTPAVFPETPRLSYAESMKPLPRPSDSHTPTPAGPTVKFRTKTTSLSPRDLTDAARRARELYEKEHPTRPR